MSFVVIITFISLCMAVISLLLMRWRILGVGGGFSWFFFWCALGLFSIQRDALKGVMSLVSMVDFTNFLLTFSSFFFIVIIFLLYVNQRKQRKGIEKLTQEIALIRFSNTLREKDETN